MGRSSAGRISWVFRTPARPGTGRCPRWRSQDSHRGAARRAARSRSGTTGSAPRSSTTTMVSPRSLPTLAGRGAAHNVKFGGDFHWQRMNHYEISPLTSMAFTGIATTLNGGPAANSYNALADFLLGQIGGNMSNAQVPPCVVSDACAPDRPVTMREREMGFYVRDQWQIGQKLTASFGLRWEYYPVPVRADRGVEHFDLATNRVLMCGMANNSDTCGVDGSKGSVHTSSGHRIPSHSNPSSSAPDTRGIRRTTTCTAVPPIPIPRRSRSRRSG